MADRAECEFVRAIAPELALGIAPGDERARALTHLSHCPERCRLVEELYLTPDRMAQRRGNRGRTHVRWWPDDQDIGCAAQVTLLKCFIEPHHLFGPRQPPEQAVKRVADGAPEHKGILLVSAVGGGQGLLKE